MRLDATAALQRPGSLVYKLGILPGSMSLEATHRPGIVNAVLMFLPALGSSIAV